MIFAVAPRCASHKRLAMRLRFGSRPMINHPTKKAPFQGHFCWLLHLEGLSEVSLNDLRRYATLRFAQAACDAVPIWFASNDKSPNKKSPVSGAFLLAASPGLEPRLTESESAVLPLDDEAFAVSFTYIRQKKQLVKYFYQKFLSL